PGAVAAGAAKTRSAWSYRGSGTCSDPQGPAGDAVSVTGGDPPPGRRPRTHHAWHDEAPSTPSAEGRTHATDDMTRRQAPRGAKPQWFTRRLSSRSIPPRRRDGRQRARRIGKQDGQRCPPRGHRTHHGSPSVERVASRSGPPGRTK